MLAEKLQNKKIILASGSPRRRELLAGLDIEFTTDTGNIFDEVYPPELPHNEIPEYLAKGKSYGFHRELVKDEILITADTLVFCCGEILCKPKDKADAVRMIQMLQNNNHTVLTGVCLRSTDKIKSFTASTKVHFSSLSVEETEYYVEKYRPYDKAGSYGVQEWIGYACISGIEGSYYNVMGLPVQRLYRELEKF